MCFVLEDDDVLLLTNEATAKGRALQRDPRVTLAVDDETPPFAFVMIEGTAQLSRSPDDIAAVDLELTAEHRHRLDTISVLDEGFPYDFMTRPGTGKLPFGESYRHLHDHRRDRSGRPLDSPAASR